MTLNEKVRGSGGLWVDSEAVVESLDLARGGDVHRLGVVVVVVHAHVVGVGGGLVSAGDQGEEGSS